jgi:hypothetical protein
MPTLDPKALRFLALLSAPLFTLLKGKLGVDVPLEVQEMLVGTVALYIFGSHAKEAIVAKANAAGVAAAATVTPGPAADAVVDAAAKGGVQ